MIELNPQFFSRIWVTRIFLFISQSKNNCIGRKVARGLHAGNNTVYNAIETLHSLGLIKKDCLNGREKIISLTSKGREVFDYLNKINNLLDENNQTDL